MVEATNERGRAEAGGVAARDALGPHVHVVVRCYDDYVSSITHAALRGYILARQTRPWRLERHRLGESTLEWGEEGAGFVASGMAKPGSVTFYLSGSGDGPRYANGREVGEGALVRWTGGADLSLNVPQPGTWYALTIPAGAWGRLSEKFPGLASDHGGPSSAAIDVAPERLQRLRAVLRGAADAVDAAGPEGLAPAASRQLEWNALVEVLRATGGAQERSRGAGRPRISRLRVLGQLHDLLAARSSEPLYVADLCAATGLSERTLRHVVVEQYGMSPMRLLRSRRLCQLREALRDPANGGTRITVLAGRLGFWHMGQLAADYRRLFGELPSATAGSARART